jgi:DNA-binding NarL/FixJ family response regulator
MVSVIGPQETRTTLTTVAVVEDDQRVRDSLSVLIGGANGFTCAGTYATGEAALEGIPKSPPNVVLMDINLPKISGIECVQRLKAVCPTLMVIMLTVHEDDDAIFKALQAGANGYLLKRTPPGEILDAISDAHRGGAPMSSSIARKVIQSFHQDPSKVAQSTESTALTAREREVLELLAKGYLYKEIGALFGIQFETVHTHVRNIYQKMHVRSRSEAVAKFLRP